MPIFKKHYEEFQTVAGYPATPDGQEKMLADIMTIVRAIPNGRGLGVFWWDATWTAVQGMVGNVPTQFPEITGKIRPSSITTIEPCLL